MKEKTIAEKIFFISNKLLFIISVVYLVCVIYSIAFFCSSEVLQTLAYSFMIIYLSRMELCLFATLRLK